MWAFGCFVVGLSLLFGQVQNQGVTHDGQQFLILEAGDFRRDEKDTALRMMCNLVQLFYFRCFLHQCRPVEVDPLTAVWRATIRQDTSRVSSVRPSRCRFTCSHPSNDTGFRRSWLGDSSGWPFWKSLHARESFLFVAFAIEATPQRRFRCLLVPLVSKQERYSDHIRFNKFVPINSDAWILWTWNLLNSLLCIFDLFLVFQIPFIVQSGKCMKPTNIGSVFRY